MTVYEFWKKAYILLGDKFEGVNNSSWDNLLVDWRKVNRGHDEYSGWNHDNSVLDKDCYVIRKILKGKEIWTFTQKFFDEMEKEIDI